MPGVQAATAMSDLPFNRLAQRYNTGAENYTNADGTPVAIVDYYQFVMSDYFETMRHPDRGRPRLRRKRHDVGRPRRHRQ